MFGFYLKDQIKKVKYFFKWIVKVFQYAVFLWNDRDYDYVYILKLLKYKLKRTRKYILKDSLIVEAKDIYNEIKTAEDLIDKILECNYYEEEFDEHFKKYGSLWEHDFLSEEDKIKSNKEFGRIWRKKHKALEDDWNKFWDLLRDKFRGWWD